MSDCWNNDALMEGAADSMFADPDEAIFSDEVFAAQLARDAASTQSPAERMETDRLAGEFAHRFRMARAAESFMRSVPSRVMREAFPPIYGTASDVMPFAAGSGHAVMVEPRVAAGAGADFWDAPVESWLELPPEMPAGEYVAFPVIGDSMSPAIDTGDIVLVRLGTDVAVGDVVVARADDGYLVKYVSDLRGAQVELASFNTEQPRFCIERDPGRIVGTVLARFHR